MKNMDTRDLLITKLGLELAEYKRRIRKLSQEELIEKSYQTVCMIDIYEMLVEMCMELQEEDIQQLLVFPAVLSHFYHKWLKRNDSCWDELKNCVTNNIHEMRKAYREIQEDAA